MKLLHDHTVLLTTAALSLSACTSRANLADVPGTYVMNKGRAADTLIVEADRTYRRVYSAPDQPTVLDAGKWSVDTVGTQVLVTFEHFAPRWRAETDIKASPIVGFWPVEPERRSDSLIQLVVDDDLGWAYVQRRR